MIHRITYHHIFRIVMRVESKQEEVGDIVLAKVESRSIHTIELDQREHLLVLLCINADGGKIPNFYILKGAYFQQDYIKNYEENVVMAMQPNTWMTKKLLHSGISHFIGSKKSSMN